MEENLLSYELFQQVFFKYYNPLCQYALTLVNEPHTCEDIVQEVFLRVWEKKKDLLDKNDIRFYLFTAVRNNCLTSLDKKKKSVLVALHGQEQDMDLPDVNKGKEKEVDIAVLVKEALDRLPEKCREVFVLSRISKLTYQQIADTLGISIKTVENQMGKAIGIMRSFIKEKQPFINNIFLFLSLFGLVQ